MNSVGLRAYYKTSTSYRDRLLEKNADYFSAYLRLMHRCVPAGSRILDLGAGTGLSSRLLADDYCVVGADLSWLFIRERGGTNHRNPRYLCADAQTLPFASGSFDAVGMFECIEHLSDVGAALLEIDRVLKPNGMLVIISPNLLSPVNAGLRFVARRASANVAPGSFIEASRRLFRITAKLLDSNLHFDERSVPDRPDLHSDMDACYAATPVDLRQWATLRGYGLVRYQQDGRSKVGRVANRALRSYGPTIYLAARKPTTDSPCAA
jgi:SAM-dependent methyltransferase